MRAAEWYEGWTAANWVALFVALLALAGVLGQAIQKAVTDKRTTWWTRAQWGMERLEPGEHTPTAYVAERRAVAITTIGYLAVTRLAGADEQEYFAEVMSIITGVANPPAGG